MLSLRYCTALATTLMGSQSHLQGWGFWAHREINEKAVYLLPVPMLRFYKQHVAYLRRCATRADERRFLVEGEEKNHYLDWEYYSPGQGAALPRYLHEAQAQYTAAELEEHGVLPWNIYQRMGQLTEAFSQRDAARILHLSADLGHYIADAHVPLHTTVNYDGQASGQEGIHALWETRLPELFGKGYDCWAGKPVYFEDAQKAIWEIVEESHLLVEVLLAAERVLDAAYPAHKKYIYEVRGTTLRRTYTVAYAKAYQEALHKQVEHRFRSSVHAVASFWYTAWVNAGRPELPGDEPVVYREEEEMGEGVAELTHGCGCAQEVVATAEEEGEEEEGDEEEKEE